MLRDDWIAAGKGTELRNHIPNTLLSICQRPHGVFQNRVLTRVNSGSHQESPAGVYLQLLYSLSVN